MRLISYGAWERDLRRRGWRDWPHWILFGILSAASVLAGGMWPLLVTPAVLVIDYVRSCIRLAKLPPPPG